MIQQVLIGLGLLVGIIGCFSNPFIGVITLMGVNMIQPGELYPIFNALHVERLMALLVFAMVLIKRISFRFPPPTRWCLVFYGAVVASIPLAFWISNAYDNAVEFAKTIALSLLLVTLATTRQRIRAVLITFSLLVTYLAGSSLIQYFEGNFQFRMDVDRAVGLTSASNNPDTLGLTIVTAMPLMFLLTLRGNPAWLRWLMRALLVVCFWALMLTGSRGTVMSLALILALAACVSRRRALILPVALAAGLTVWSVLPAQYRARYSSVENLQNDDSYQNRLLSWQGGWHMFLDHPLTGVGAGNYTAANGAKYWPAPRKVYLNAHSIYFQTLGELGLVGVIAFTGFVVVLFKSNNVLRREATEDDPLWVRRYPMACNLSMIALLYTGYAYHDLYRSTWYFLAALTGALMLSRQYEPRRKPAPESTTLAAPAVAELTTDWSVPA